MKPETLPAAVAGVDGLFQVAAVYRFHAKDPETEVVRPTVEGSNNILQAAHAAGVKKVVLTSSIGAVGFGAQGGRALTEADWNDRACIPYFVAKTRAEREAFRFAEQSGLNLVAINPGVILGPGFHRHTDSTRLVENLVRGKIPMAIPMHFAYVDARDVAEAQRLLYEHEQAAGRYLCVGETMTHLEFSAMVGGVDPALKVPSKNMPGFMVNVLPFLDWLEHKTKGTPRGFTRAAAREFGGRDMVYESDRMRAELGWQPRPLAQTVQDTVQWIQERFPTDQR